MCFWEGKNKDMHNDLLLNPKYVEPVEYIFPHDVAPYKPINLSNSKISRLHFHSTFEIGFCCTGNGECTTIDGVFPFNAGDITFFPPYKSHFSRSYDDVQSQWYWFYFDVKPSFSLPGFQPDFWNSLAENLSRYSGVISNKHYPQLCENVYEIIQIANDANISTKKTQISLLIAKFLLETSNVLKSETFGTLKQTKENPNLDILAKISPALQHIRQHYQEPINLEKLAASCNLSVASFRRYFHIALNKSPYEHLISVRMDIAKYYLRNTDMTVNSIAISCGIPDPSNFTRYFTKSFNQSPSEYRASRKKRSLEG